MMNKLENKFYTREEVEAAMSGSYWGGCAVGAIATFITLAIVGYLSSKGIILN